LGELVSGATRRHVHHMGEHQLVYHPPRLELFVVQCAMIICFPIVTANWLPAAFLVQTPKCAELFFVGHPLQLVNGITVCLQGDDFKCCSYEKIPVLWCAGASS